MIFELPRGNKLILVVTRDNLLVVNNIDKKGVCLDAIGLIVAPWKCNFLKTSMFVFEAWLLGQILVLRTSNSADSSLTETQFSLDLSQDHIPCDIFFAQ